MRIGVTLVLVSLALAGCADESKPATTSTDDPTVAVEVTDDTGAIRGVVVNDAIVPVAGATISILNTELTTSTDENGAFGFSRVIPGTYFGTVSKDLHAEVQFNVEVVAGVEAPEIVKVQLDRQFKQDPYAVTIPNSGSFTCSQGNMPGYLYSSSSCHDNGIGSFLAGYTGVEEIPSTDGSQYGVELTQERTFHSDVAEGWQNLVFEMQWETSATGTSQEMGIVVSTYKPEREGGHWFANYQSESPLRFQINVGEQFTGPGDPVGSVEPKMIPAEGWKDMSYFTSVRPPSDAECVLWCVPPGFAIDQGFDVYQTQFYYATVPEGWSYLAGDTNPYSR